MKVLHINITDWGGGAAIAAHRLNDAMVKAGIDSSMLVLNKQTNDPNVYEHPIGKLRRLGLRILDYAFFKSFNYYASWSLNSIGCDFSNNKLIDEADIIYIHWINNYCLSLKSIEKILEKGKPVYWYMHEMWPLTGGCHYALSCKKFTDHCQKCPMSHYRKGSWRKKDLSYWQFNDKITRFTQYSNLKFITPSKWLADQVKASRLFRNHEVSVKPNLLDTQQFKPYDKNDARKELGLPQDINLILFGADNIHSEYKGWNLLKDALNMGFENTECVIYGRVNESDLQGIDIKIHNMGLIRNHADLVKLYSACDIFVTPSLADNYPNVLVEAMACGLVCVGYNIGGIPEIIKDGKSGKIVRDINSKSLHSAIQNLLTNPLLADYSINARNQIVEYNSYENVLEIHDFN